MNAIKEMLFTGWNLMRWFRLGFGIFFAIEAFRDSDKLFAIAAAFLLFTAIFNTGCSGSSGCAVPDRRTGKSKE